MKDWRIEYHDDGPDDKGRRHFTIFWIGYRVDLDADGPKAQGFFADPETYLARQGSGLHGPKRSRKSPDHAAGVE